MKLKMILAMLFLCLLSFAGHAYAQRGPQRLPPYLTDPTGKELKRSSFFVEKYYYIYARSVNPNETSRVIRLVGHSASLEVYAYLIFSDRDADKPPVYDEASYTLFINYPEAYFPEIEAILKGPGRVLCQIYIIDKDSIWASVESPIIERK